MIPYKFVNFRFRHVSRTKIVKMGKAKKIKVSRSDGEKGQSLADQVISDSTVKQSGRVKVRKREEEPSEVSVGRSVIYHNFKKSLK